MPPSFIHQDARRLEVLCLSLSLVLTLSNLISNRTHWGVELHSESQWTCFSAVKEKDGGEKNGKSEALAWQTDRKRWGGFLNVTWQSPLLVRQRRRRTKQEIDDLFLYWGQTTFSESVSLNPVSAGALVSDPHTHTVTTQTGQTHNLKTSHLERSCSFSHPYCRRVASGGPFNVKFTLFNEEFHAHLLNWPKRTVWLRLIRQSAGYPPGGYTCFSSSGIHDHDTVLILQPQVPFGIKSCRWGIWSLCANRTHHSLTAFSESTQNAQNWHCNKCGMKKDATQTLWIAFGSVR